ATRALAFEELRDRVGLAPSAILRAPLETLEAITARGILAVRFAAKLRLAAEKAVAEHGGDVDSATRQAFAAAPERAIELLCGYPGVGRPGAERILMFMGLLPAVALDSHGLRVLTRLGVVTERRSYDTTYRAARATLGGAGPQPIALLEEL